MTAREGRGGRRPGAGRPKGTARGRTTVTVALELTPEQREWLDAEAARRGTSRSQVARDVLDAGRTAPADAGDAG